jgi:hypothetical protein
MGVDIYSARKKFISVQLSNGSVVRAYPLAYFCKLRDFGDAFDSCSYHYKELFDLRIRVGRTINVFSSDTVEYVYVPHSNTNNKAHKGLVVYRADTLIGANTAAGDMSQDSSCYSYDPLFWADCDSLGTPVGVLTERSRTGRKLGSWQVTEPTDTLTDAGYEVAREIDRKYHARNQAQRV